LSISRASCGEGSGVDPQKPQRGPLAGPSGRASLQRKFAFWKLKPVETALGDIVSITVDKAVRKPDEECQRVPNGDAVGNVERLDIGRKYLEPRAFE
jgi:hypothetical protein